MDEPKSPDKVLNSPITENKEDKGEPQDQGGNSNNLFAKFKPPATETKTIASKPSDETMRAVQTIVSPSNSADSQMESPAQTLLKQESPVEINDKTDVSTPGVEIAVAVEESVDVHVIQPDAQEVKPAAMVTTEDYKTVPPKPPPKLDIDQDFHPDYIPEGIAKPLGVVVIEQHWVAIPNRTRVGDIHGKLRDVERFGPRPLKILFDKADAGKKIYCIPFFNDPGHFNFDIEPRFFPTLDEYGYRLLWKYTNARNPDYGYVWYMESSLVWAAPKGKLESELVGSSKTVGASKGKVESGDSTAKSTATVRKSGRVENEQLPNGHSFSVCQRMVPDDLVPYGGQYYLIHLNRQTDFGTYCILADKATGERKIVDGVRLGENDLTFLSYTSYDPPDLPFAVSHKLVHLLRESKKDRLKGGRATFIDNPYQKMIAASTRLEDTVSDIVSGKGDAAKLLPKGRKRKLSDSSMASNTTNQTSTTNQRRRAMDFELRSPTYEELLDENSRLKRAAAHQGVDLSLFASAADLALDNVADATATLKDERAKMMDVNSTLASTARQLETTSQRTADLQENFYSTTKLQIQTLFRLYAQHQQNIPHSPMATGYPGPLEHGFRGYMSSGLEHLFRPPPTAPPISTPPREELAPSILSDPIEHNSAEKIARQKQATEAAKMSLSFPPPAVVRTDSGSDITIRPSELIAVNSANIPVSVAAVFDLDTAKERSDAELAAAEGQEKVVKLVETAEEKAERHRKMEAEKLVLEDKRQAQMRAVSEKRQSNSPQAGQSTSNAWGIMQPTLQLNRLEAAVKEEGPVLDAEPQEDIDDNASVASNDVNVKVNDPPDYNIPLSDIAYNEYAMLVKGQVVKEGDIGYLGFHTDIEYAKLLAVPGPDYGQRSDFDGETAFVNNNTRSNALKYVNRQLSKDGRQMFLLKACEWTCAPNKPDRNVDTHIHGLFKFHLCNLFEHNRPPEIDTYEKLKVSLNRTIYFMEHFPNNSPSVDQQMITLRISPWFDACVLATLNSGFRYLPRKLEKIISALLRHFKRFTLPQYKHCVVADPLACMSDKLKSEPNVFEEGTPGIYDISPTDRKAMIQSAKSFCRNRTDFDRLLANRRVQLAKPSIQRKRKPKTTDEVIQLDDSPPKARSKAEPAIKRRKTDKSEKKKSKDLKRAKKSKKDKKKKKNEKAIEKTSEKPHRKSESVQVKSKDKKPPAKPDYRKMKKTDIVQLLIEKEKADSSKAPESPKASSKKKHQKKSKKTSAKKSEEVDMCGKEDPNWEQDEDEGEEDASQDDDDEPSTSNAKSDSGSSSSDSSSDSSDDEDDEDESSSD